MEQLELEPAHSSSDIWSIGIILDALMAKKEVAKGGRAIKEYQRDKLSENYS
jgi:hypothetical protein